MQEFKTNYSYDKINKNESLRYDYFITEHIGNYHVFTVKGMYKYQDLEIQFTKEVKKIANEDFSTDDIRIVYFANRAIITENVLLQMREENPIINAEIKQAQEEKKTVLLKSQLLNDTKSKLLETNLKTGRKK